MPRRGKKERLKPTVGTKKKEKEQHEKGSVEEKGEGTNSMREKNHVSNRHMTWWQKSWWARMDNGPHLRTARGRRQAWRAATRAAREMRVTEETQCAVWRDRKRETAEVEKKRKQHVARRAAPTHQHNPSSSNSSSNAAAPVTVTSAKCL